MVTFYVCIPIRSLFMGVYIPDIMVTYYVCIPIPDIMITYVLCVYTYTKYNGHLRYIAKKTWRTLREASRIIREAPS